MNERRIETRYGIEAYIGKKGDIVLKQDNPMEEDSLIFMTPQDVPIVIEWLQELLEERKHFTPEKE